MNQSPYPARRPPRNAQNLAQRLPTFTEENGREIALVPLANSDKVAKVYREDYERLRELGASPNWYLSKGGGNLTYVRAYVLGRSACVARLLTDAPRDRIVTYRQGDSLDLRRDALIVQRRGAHKRRRGDDREGLRLSMVVLKFAKKLEGATGDRIRAALRALEESEPGYTNATAAKKAAPKPIPCTRSGTRTF